MNSTTDIRQYLWVNVYLKNCDTCSSRQATNYANSAVDAFDDRFADGLVKPVIEYPVLKDLDVRV